MAGTGALPLAAKFALVGAVWGTTNTLCGRATRTAEPEPADSVAGRIANELRVLADWRFTVPFLLNQSGSLLYYYLLGSLEAELSLAVPACNSSTFVFTALSSWALGEQLGNSVRWLGAGVVLILAGVFVCCTATLAHAE